jgi:hypothetical protein
MSSVEILFHDSATSQLEVLYGYQRVSGAEFARLLREIDELSASFRVQGSALPVGVKRVAG